MSSFRIIRTPNNAIVVNDLLNVLLNPKTKFRSLKKALITVNNDSTQTRFNVSDQKIEEVLTSTNIKCITTFDLLKRVMPKSGNLLKINKIDIMRDFIIFNNDVFKISTILKSKDYISVESDDDFAVIPVKDFKKEYSKIIKLKKRHGLRLDYFYIDKLGMKLTTAYRIYRFLNL